MRFYPPAPQDDTKRFEPIDYSFSERISGILKFDTQVLADIAECKPWMQITAIIILSVIIQVSLGFAYTIIASWEQINQLDLISPEILKPLMLALALSTLISLITAFLTLIFGGLTYHLTNRLMGGQGNFRETLAAYGYIQLWMIPAAIASIPPTLIDMTILTKAITVITYLIIAAEMIRATKKIHNLTTLRATAAAILSLIIIAAVLTLFASALNTLLAPTAGHRAYIEINKIIQ